jgi:hypothetical protein
VTPSSNPLCYPLFFPNGEPGWTTNMKQLGPRALYNEQQVEEEHREALENHLGQSQAGSNTPPPKKRVIRDKITLTDYFKYEFSIRKHFDVAARRIFRRFPLHYGCKLMKQYQIDCALKIQANNLNYIRTHQR